MRQIQYRDQTWHRWNRAMSAFTHLEENLITKKNVEKHKFLSVSDCCRSSKTIKTNSTLFIKKYWGGGDTFPYFSLPEKISHLFQRMRMRQVYLTNV